MTTTLISLTAAAALAAPTIVHAQEIHAPGGTTTMKAAAVTKPTQSGYIEANGVNYYYEVHGQGEPLLLLHGGLGSIDMFGPVMKGTPMYQSYAAIAPNPEEFPKLLDRMGELMRQPYDWRDDVGTLAMPVMLVFGDSDMYRPEHMVEFYQLLGGGLKDAG